MGLSVRHHPYSCLRRHISTARHPIPDVPVIYLLEPSAPSLQGVTNDLQKGLYSPAYINFLSSVSRPLLEDFASQTVAAGTSEKIAKIWDQYLNFICSEPDLFSLGMQKEHTYWALNSAKTTDKELDHVVDRIVSGLFSVVVTMGKKKSMAALGFVPVARRANLFTRRHPHHTLSKRCSSGNDIGQARSEAP